jgi:hypothetical protein
MAFFSTIRRQPFVAASGVLRVGPELPSVHCTDAPDDFAKVHSVDATAAAKQISELAAVAPTSAGS